MKPIRINQDDIKKAFNRGIHTYKSGKEVSINESRKIP